MRKIASLLSLCNYQLDRIEQRKAAGVTEAAAKGLEMAKHNWHTAHSLAVDILEEYTELATRYKLEQGNVKRAQLQTDMERKMNLLKETGEVFKQHSYVEKLQAENEALKAELKELKEKNYLDH